MNKICERCNAPIPDDYINLLCGICYSKIEGDKSQVSKNENKNEEQPQPPTPPRVANEVGISDPAYQENPEADDKEQWQANITQFSKTGKLIWHPTRNMYEFIKRYCLDKIVKHPQYPKFIWKPKIVDVGCGVGLGSNIMSQEADFVWGIDKNEKSIQFAQECFTRYKNNIYYSTQVTFDRLDIMQDTRDFMQFDLVVAIEVLEHIYDVNGFVQRLVTKLSKKDNGGNYNIPDHTEFFFSTPNRNNKHISKVKPQNKYHVREYTSGEVFNFMKKYFEKVELFNSAGEPIPPKEHETTTHTPILLKCSIPHQ